MEPIRYSRTGGYAHGDTRKLAQKLPPSVKRFYGVRGGLGGREGDGGRVERGQGAMTNGTRPTNQPTNHNRPQPNQPNRKQMEHEFETK
jgi:hypothetical protein